MIVRTHEDVLGFDVAVDEPDVMGGVQRLGNLREEAHGPSGIELPGEDQVLERGPADHPHGEEEPVLTFSGLVHGDDVRVVDRRLELALAAEALAERGLVARLGRDDLQRGGTVQRQLGGPVDDRHTAGPQDPIDPVASDDRSLVQHGLAIVCGQPRRAARLSPSLGFRCASK